MGDKADLSEMTKFDKSPKQGEKNPSWRNKQSNQRSKVDLGNKIKNNNTFLMLFQNFLRLQMPSFNVCRYKIKQHGLMEKMANE